MRLVAVSIVRNEADIIEAFVRHTRAWVDQHLIFDHNSTDGTREILLALRAEGLPLGLFTDDSPENLQQGRSNHLTRLAARDHGADWIVPLDADEILIAPDRTALERALAAGEAGVAASLPLLNYYPTREDDPAVANPVLRLRHCQAAPPATRKVMVPRALALDASVEAGKGSHALLRGPERLPERPLPDGFHLAHFALRSPEQQVLRVVLRELQKLAGGRAQAGLDEHYRLGFQLLAENPGLFFSTVCPPAASLRLQPAVYRGDPPRYGSQSAGWNRVAMSLLPFLEQLASSHGRLLDGDKPAAPAPAGLRALEAGAARANTDPETPAFAGFVAQEGWGPREGPVPEAFLPAFHWGYAPATHLRVLSARSRGAAFTAEALTYSENQEITLELNGTPVLRHAFGRVNQKESLVAPLALRAGENHLRLHYRQALRTSYDSRALAAIFLRLRIEPETT